MHAEKDGQTALPAWWCTSRMHRRKKIRWTWRENACGKRRTNGTSGVVVYE